MDGRHSARNMCLELPIPPNSPIPVIRERGCPRRSAREVTWESRKGISHDPAGDAGDLPFPMGNS